MEKIAIGADHGGYEYKKQIIRELENKGYTVKDFGTDSAESCDYPIYAKLVANAIANNEYDKGILICGTGAIEITNIWLETPFSNEERHIKRINMIE